jgi:hypothetical protein
LYPDKYKQTVTKEKKMSPPTLKPLTGDRITELWALFGPPPVLSTEDKEAYDSLRKGFVAYYRPTNTLHLTLIREVVDTEWEIFRLVRHRTRALERRYRKPFEEKLAKLLEGSHWNSDHLIQELLFRQRQPNELDYNRALEEAAKFMDVLDKWLNTATARRNSVLKLLEYYCGSTDDRNEVTDGEYKEVEQDDVNKIPAPLLAPAESDPHRVTTANHSEPVELSKE